MLNHYRLSKIRSIYQDCYSFQVQFLKLFSFFSAINYDSKIRKIRFCPTDNFSDIFAYFWPWFENQHNQVNSYNVGEWYHSNHQENSKDHYVADVSSNLSKNVVKIRVLRTHWFYRGKTLDWNGWSRDEHIIVKHFLHVNFSTSTEFHNIKCYTLMCLNPRPTASV